MIAYRFRTNRKGEMGEGVLAQDMARELRRRLLLIRGRLALKEGKDRGPFRPRKDAIHRYVVQMTGETEPGRVMRLVNERRKFVEGRVIEVDVTDTTGNELVDNFFTALRLRYGPPQNLGAAVCKTIGSTSTKSQHRRWKAISTWKKYGFSKMAASAGGNAIDWAFTSRARLDESFYWAITVADEYQLQNIIHWPEDSKVPLIWNPSGGLHTYSIPSGGSDHKGHGHADFRPTRASGDDC